MESKLTILVVENTREKLGETNEAVGESAERSMVKRWKKARVVQDSAVLQTSLANIH